jgi:hypothetical protein
VILEVLCRQCFSTSEKRITWLPVEVDETGRYEVVCPYGHKCLTIIALDRFELLFQAGAVAIYNGYPREGVASIAAAVERFQEFCLKVFSAHANVKYRDYEKAWKTMSKKSERQAGAFTFAYLHTMKEVPPTLREDTVIKFRNDVIHAGRFPNRAEAIDFGEKCLAFIFQILKELYPKFATEMSTARSLEYFRDAKTIRQLADSEIELALLSESLVIDLDSIDKDSFGTHTFVEYLARMDARKRERDALRSKYMLPGMARRRDLRP